MKWLLLVLELFMLFVANNALFWLPGHYGWFNFVAATIAIFIAAFLAWFSGKAFVNSSIQGKSGWQKFVATPPVIVWLAVVFAFGLAGLMKIASH